MLRFGAAIVWWRYEHTNVGIYSEIREIASREFRSSRRALLLLNCMVVAVQKAIRGLGGRKGACWRAYIAYIDLRGCVTTLSEEGKFVDAISEGSREAGLGRGEQAIGDWHSFRSNDRRRFAAPIVFANYASGGRTIGGGPH